MRSFNLVTRSVNSVMRSYHYVFFVCALCMRCFYALFLRALFVCSFYAPFLCALCIRSLYALFLFAHFMRSFYVLFLCALFMCSFYALLLCALCIHSFYVLFLCALFMCYLMRSFHKRLAILRMLKKYYCTKTNMADNKMDDVLKKLVLSHH